MARMKVAIVGVGKIAIDQHVPSIAETGAMDLAALVSQRGVTLPGIPTFRTQGEMLAAMPEIGAVAICTPPDIRYGYVREALKAGRHVLMEKPPTASLMELADLEALARTTGRALFATWHSQFNTAVDAAKTMLWGAAIERIQVTWKEDVRRWHPGQEWIWQPGGFGVFDPGINALSILTKILPFPTFVSKAVLQFPANRDTPIAASLALRAPSDVGLSGYGAEFDWRQEGEQTWTIAIDLKDGRHVELLRGGTCLTINGVATIDETDQEYRHIYRRFADLVMTSGIDVDAAPLRIVADSFLIGRRAVTDAFDW
ncbi:MAG: Gfo/Idh/MocA family protein [Labrys sp. (in: a-proteobacteria)]